MPSVTDPKVQVCIFYRHFLKNALASPGPAR